MPRYRINRTLKVPCPATDNGRPTVKGRLFQAGDEFEAADVTAGALASLLRTRDASPVAQPDPATVFAAAMEGTPPVEAAAPAPEPPPAVPSGPLVGPPGEAPASAPEQPRVEPKQPDQKRKK